MKASPNTRANPRMSATGVSTNHSSTVKSTDHSQNEEHAQSDDVLVDGYAGDVNPNLAGSPEMLQLHDPMAGPLNAWQENDCYREFFLEAEVPVPRMYGEENDLPDFDDNGGLPSDDGLHGYNGDRETVLSPIITRRL